MLIYEGDAFRENILYTYYLAKILEFKYLLMYSQHFSVFWNIFNRSKYMVTISFKKLKVPMFIRQCRLLGL